MALTGKLRHVQTTDKIRAPLSNLLPKNGEPGKARVMVLDKKAHARIREYMQKHGISPADERSDLPTRLRAELPPIKGSVHIGTGRVATTKWIAERFRKARFT